MDMVRPMLSSPSIFYHYWVITKFIVVLNMMVMPVVVLKGIMLLKMFRIWHTNNLELPTHWLIIQLGQ